MTIRHTLSAGLAATALAAGLTTAATLAPVSALAPQSAQAADEDDPEPQVQIYEENGVNGPAVAHAIEEIVTGDRGKFTKDAVAAAFENDEGNYNVLMMNLSQGYDKSGLEGVKLYANVTWGSVHYGLWIVEGGTFKNTGDGGYDNWAFRGWFDRPDDGTVVFTP